MHEAEFLDPLGGRAVLCSGTYPEVCRPGFRAPLPRDVPSGKSLNLSGRMIGLESVRVQWILSHHV